MSLPRTGCSLVRVSERLAQRESAWQELDLLIARVGGGRFRPTAQEVLRLGELYRAACADLMLAEDHDLPRQTVSYLHALVGRAHNLIYRRVGLQFSRLGPILVSDGSAPAAVGPCVADCGLGLLGGVLDGGVAGGGARRFRRASRRRDDGGTDGPDVFRAGQRRAQGRNAAQRHGHGRILHRP